MRGKGFNFTDNFDLEERQALVPDATCLGFMISMRLIAEIFEARAGVCFLKYLGC